MKGSVPRAEARESESLKAAVKRLAEVVGRLEKLARRRIEELGPPLSFDNMNEEDIEKRVIGFSESLIKFLKLRKQLVESQRVMGKSLKGLQNARDDREISTLIGPTLLADQKEYVADNIRLTMCFDKEVAPRSPIISRIVDWSAQVNDFSKWVADLVRRNSERGEDDLTRMIEAITKGDINRFNFIHKELSERLEQEEPHYAPKL